ncbi:MAG: DEAD/DEAH box helicase [Candidatus Nanohaloarchaea archaeon]
MKVENLGLPEKAKQEYLDSGITELNPPQVKAVESGLLDGEDMIVASPTASGKTLIAEMAMARQVIDEGRKAVYIVPLKALAWEKYQDFDERYEDLNVRISVGDLDESGSGLETADIVIVTSEKLDSLLRHNPSWIHEIGLVVTDEIHLLTSKNRGPTLEVTLTRLRGLLDFQMLGLSATISNSGELADWLDAELVESTYRPVELQHGIYWGNEIEFYPEDFETGEETAEGFKTGTQLKEEEEKLQDTEVQQVKNLHDRGILNLVEDTLDKEKQAIIFCNSRKGAEKSSDRTGSVVKEDLDREEKQELEEYADQIENVLGSPTSQCRRLAKNVRKGAAFHHAGLLSEQRTLVEEAFKKGLIKTISATPTLAAGVNLPAYRVIVRDLKRYTGEGMEFIPVLEYEQMTGRAGRPEYDDHGEAISIAKQPGMKDEILDRYIAGEAERIQSKLAVEPVLRMHTLSLVASRYCSTMDELLEFYRETFYAHQFGEMTEVDRQVKKVVDQLRDYEFLRQDELKATKVGRRVSELYLDPDSAHLMLESMERATEKETEPVSFLFMLSRTTEMQPRLRVKDDEWNDIEKALFDAEKYILEDIPEEWSPDYEDFLESMKTSLMMEAWMNELDEEKIMNRYGIAPGVVRAKMRNADWLVYAAKELARMKDYGIMDELEKIRLRLKHGIKEELLPLVKYDQIGRVRARKLHDHGIKSQEQIREVSFTKLKKLVGKRAAEMLKQQVGQENYFDRENIMDYFD